MCPNCGYCPTCGRSHGYSAGQYYPTGGLNVMTTPADPQMMAIHQNSLQMNAAHQNMLLMNSAQPPTMGMLQQAQTYGTPSTY